MESNYTNIKIKQKRVSNDVYLHVFVVFEYPALLMCHFY